MKYSESPFGRVLQRHSAAVVLLLGTATLEAELTWLERESGTTNELTAVTAGPGGWVAAGARGTILTSLDRLAWIERLANTNLSFEGVGHGADRFVAVGREGAVWTSDDGTDWAAAESNSTNWLSAVTWANGMFVAVGDQGTVLTSPAGTNWTAQEPATANFLSAVTAAEAQLVAVGFRGAIVTSTNGTNWASTSWDTDVAADSWLQGIAHGNGRFVAVGFKELSAATGASGLVLTSTNGLDWTMSDGQFEQLLDDVAFDGSRFVAVGASGVILTSVDGLNWLENDPGQGKYLRAVAADDEGLAAVGTRGTILISSEQAISDQIRLTQAHLDPEGFFTFLIEGAAPGQALRVQASSDFAGWEEIGQLQGATEAVSFSDPEPAAADFRFYRVVSP